MYLYRSSTLSSRGRNGNASCIKFHTSRTGRKRHDSGCTEQAWGEINQNPCNNFVVIAGIFIFNFSYPKSCGHKAGFADVNESSDSFRFGIVFRQQIL